MSVYRHAAGVVTLICVLPQPCFGLGLGQRGIQEEVVVTATQNSGSPTSPSVDEARARLERIPGGIGFVEADEFLDDFAQSLGDTLVFTPGVFADTSAQRENRISVRGSGLNSSFERRGLTLLRDGIPITRASGSTEFQEIDPLSVRYIEVFKGANSLYYGASSLGGAINIVTPTGITAEEKVKVRVEGGSFDSIRANASIAHAQDDLDLFVGISGLKSDGFRDHSEVESGYGFANFGYRISEQVETRFYLTALSDNFELAGSQSLEEALNNPNESPPSVTVGPFFPGGAVTVLDAGPIADDWDRNLDVVRIANRTAIDLTSAQLEGGAWYSYRGLDHAITRFAGIIDQHENEFGVFARANGESTIAGVPVGWRSGIEANHAQNDARTWQNNFGRRGALRTENDQTSTNALVYGQVDLHIQDQLTAIFGVQGIYAKRENDAIFNDTSGSINFSQINPRFGLLWDIGSTAQAFLNVNRNFEAPSMADLTAGGAFEFTPLGAQRAWSVEVGTRGQHQYFAWDLALYRSWVDNELLDFGAPGARGFVSFTANADKTIHQGIELGTDFYIPSAFLDARRLRLTWRNVLTVNDFFFDDDQSFGDNGLAGVPDLIYVSELRLDDDSKWYIALNARWVPHGPYVDFANTTEAPGYDLWGVTAGWLFSPTVEAFISAENVFDKRYISNVTTNANQAIENSNLFTPGQGVAAYAGITIRY